MKLIKGVKKRDGKAYWDTIGVAHENQDGSVTLKFDYFPTNPEIKILMFDKDDQERSVDIA